MDFKLKKQPKGVTLIEGFPGFGLVSNIAIEFLIDHLKAVEIGEFIYDEISPIMVIHNGEAVKPMSIWHVPKYHLVLLHTTQEVKNFEWEAADTILKLAKKLNAKEIISLEGVAVTKTETEAYTYNNKKLEKCGAKKLNESIIVGVTGALMLRSDKVSPLFAGAQSSLPDGHAAAKIIEVLDKYLGLGVDYEPLLKKASEFEEKLKTIMQQSMETQQEVEKKKLSYLG